MASATVLIMQQTQTPDLPPLSDQKIPLHQVQVKVRDEDSPGFNRVLPSASGTGGARYTNTRSKKTKNGLKKQPQRGLGVAQLEKLRLQEESRREVQASCLAYAHMTIPLDSTSSSFGVRPGGAYIGLSPKLSTAASIEPADQKTSPSPASTILKGWGTAFPATSMALLRTPQDGNSINPYPSRYCTDRKPEAGRFQGIEQVLSPASSTAVLSKSPFLLSKGTQRVFAETEGYTRSSKASMDHVYPIEQHKKAVGSCSNVKLYTTTMGSAGAALNNKMAFVDLNAMESVNDASSPSLRALQLLSFQDGRQSVNGDSSKELSSFQNYTYQTASCRTDKIPGKKRSRDSTQENNSTSPRSLALALSVVPSESGQTEDGAYFRTEIQRNGALESTDNSSFLNLNKQEMSVCGPDLEDLCQKGDHIITTKKDFLALTLSSSPFSSEIGRKPEVHEDHSVPKSNSIPVNEPKKCTKFVWFNAFHEKDIAKDAETKQRLPCQKMMGECETRRFSSPDTPSKKLLVAERSTHDHDYENNLQHFATNVSISVLNVMTTGHQDQDPSTHIHADAEQILSPKDSQLNLSLDLSL